MNIQYSNAIQLHLGAFKEESVPDMKISVDGQVLHEQTQKPVDREKGWVHSMRF